MAELSIRVDDPEGGPQTAEDELRRRAFAGGSSEPGPAPGETPPADLLPCWEVPAVALCCRWDGSRLGAEAVVAALKQLPVVADAWWGCAATHLDCSKHPGDHQVRARLTGQTTLAIDPGWWIVWEPGESRLYGRTEDAFRERFVLGESSGSPFMDDAPAAGAGEQTEQ